MWSFINKTCFVLAAGLAVITIGMLSEGEDVGEISGDDLAINGNAQGGGETTQNGTASTSSGMSTGVSGVPKIPMGPLTDSEDSQERARNAISNGLMGQSSQRKCARGATRILNYYVNGTYRDKSGADAHQMGPILESDFGMSAIQDTGQYQNGDVHILTNSGVGHMEVYMNGRWYSDFPQNTSGLEWSGYNGSTLYRLGSTGG